MRAIRILVASFLCLVATVLRAGPEPMTAQQMAEYVMPPFSVGEKLNDKGVHQLLNSGGAEAGYVFETEPLAPLPGFSGAPINALVTLDLEGKFLDVLLTIKKGERLEVEAFHNGDAHLDFVKEWLKKIE